MLDTAPHKTRLRYTAVCGVCGGPRSPMGGKVCKGCYAKADVRAEYLNRGATKAFHFDPLKVETILVAPLPRIIRPKVVKPDVAARRIEIDMMVNGPGAIWLPGMYEVPARIKKPRLKKAPALKAPALPPVIPSYPYIRTPRDEHADLLAVNALVPAMPGREDICQEIMLALWEKKITVDQIKANRADLRAFVRSFKRDNFELGGYAISLDEPMRSGQSWHDVLTNEDATF